MPRIINLILTDLRRSKYNTVEKCKEKQVDWKLDGVDVDNLNNLQDRVKALLTQPGRKDYEICKDGIRINDSNVAKLNNNDSLILLDPGQKTDFPINYTQKCSAVPHTRAVTNQKGKFYGLEGTLKEFKYNVGLRSKIFG